MGDAGITSNHSVFENRVTGDGSTEPVELQGVLAQRRMENGERRAESGEQRAENGERRAASGERRTENGERRAENGERRTGNHRVLIL